MKSVEQLGGCPRMVWTDCGTENGILATLQQVFHEDANNQQTYGHRFVASPSNQRIEAWWSNFRKSRSDWWIDLFKDLTASGSFSPGNMSQTYCIRYCFMNILQKELDYVASSWNEHLIRGCNMSECPSGIPDELFFLPENSGICFGIPAFFLTHHLHVYAFLSICYTVKFR